MSLEALLLLVGGLATAALVAGTVGLARRHWRERAFRRTYAARDRARLRRWPYN